MTEVKDMDRGVGVCDECGEIFVVVSSDSGDWMMGTTDCPECGCDEFSVAEYTGKEP